MSISNLEGEYFRHFFQASAYTMMMVVSLRLFRFQVTVRDANAFLLFAIFATYINHLAANDHGLAAINIMAIIAIFELLVIAMHRIDWQFAFLIATAGYAIYSIVLFVINVIYVTIYGGQEFTLEIGGDLIAGYHFMITAIVLVIVNTVLKRFNLGIILHYRDLDISKRRGILIFTTSLFVMLILMRLGIAKHADYNHYVLAFEAILLLILIYLPMAIFMIFYYSKYRKR
jgi:hypothetical protein